MIFILRDYKARTTIIIFNKTFNIFKKFGLLINAINDFVLFNYFKIFNIKRIMRKSKYLKT